ncbi:GntR family transcriptional regulator, partial [Lentilactobacillus rapi]|uniref:GntR family transcriptional regulator n=1 Tax=Lentilactobacillus rapi TaxID=481723 RepID=UPI000ADAF796
LLSTMEWTGDKLGEVYRIKTYHTIYNQIMTLKLRPGQQVSDKQFEEQLGVSRTPVREAMLRLKRDQLLYSMPQSGTYVTKINLKKCLGCEVCPPNAGENNRQINRQYGY